MFKKAILGVVLGLILVPNVSLAANVERQALLKQIEVLTKEVARLQALLAERLKDDDTFYSSTAETRYTVVDGQLVRGRAEPRSTHQELFTELKEVIGRSAVEQYIGEFRVGHVRDSSQENYIEGYVEMLSDSNQWVLTLRRDGTKPLNDEERELFKELFVHEYAHILLDAEPTFTAAYTNRFWGDGTYRESARAKRLYERGGYGALEDAHEGLGGQFASGYAMLNPNEDMAETFGLFVEEGYPDGNSTIENKLRFFYADTSLVSERDRLRANLGL